MAILLAMSCMVLRGPDRASVSLGISLDFSPHTKHERIDATWGGHDDDEVSDTMMTMMTARCLTTVTWGGVRGLKSPLNIISVSKSSSAELSSQAILPLISITSLEVQ